MRCARWASSSGRWSNGRPTTGWAPARRAFADAPGVERVVIMTPDKDMAQCVREDGRVVCYDRRKRAFIDADGGARALRRLAGVDPRLPRAGGRFVRRVPGHSGLGQGVSRRGPDALQAPGGHPREGRALGCRGARRRLAGGVVARAPGPRVLFRELATLVFDVPIVSESLDDLRWRGAHRAAFEALCEKLAAPDLVGRVPRWAD